MRFQRCERVLPTFSVIVADGSGEIVEDDEVVSIGRPGALQQRCVVRASPAICFRVPCQPADEREVAPDRRKSSRLGERLLAVAP